ncbi:NUDIX hydrolase [Pseudogemmobacter bohemicus]|uniref:NUDIX hydrolase n=1 Tax=Pseudogemmobacter bohemicus TaxID=2250708 RepID=UPI000DD2BCE0|nr:NUDIX hydrolase [Pseudogemmobacter bohemicus]
MTRAPAPDPAPAPLPRLAALAVVVHQGKVLLVRRRNPPDQGLWGYPGGKVEFGEAVARAAERELAEETGIRARATRPLPGLDIIGPIIGPGDGTACGTGRAAWHYYLVPVVCRYLSGVPQAADDADEAAWFPIPDVLARRHPMSADVDAVLRAALHEEGIGTGGGAEIGAGAPL